MVHSNIGGALQIRRKLGIVLAVLTCCEIYFTKRNVTSPWLASRTSGFVLSPSLVAENLTTATAASTAISSNNTWAPEISVKDDEETSMDVQEEDGCGIYSRLGKHRNQQRVEATWSRYENDERRQWREVELCVLEKGHSFIRGRETLNRFRFLQLTGCKQPMTLETIRHVIKQHGTIWMIGDSVLGQQYLNLVCIMNPSVKLANFTSVMNSYGTVPSEYIYHHPQADENSTLSGKIKTTRILFSRLVLTIHKHENNLYQDAFPHAIANLTSNDAVVLTLGVHYDSRSGAPLLEKSLMYLHHQALATNSNQRPAIYFMEPTTQEFPTSNGMYAPYLEKIKAGGSWCRVLDAQALIGNRTNNLEVLWTNRLDAQGRKVMAKLLAAKAARNLTRGEEENLRSLQDRAQDSSLPNPSLFEKYLGRQVIENYHKNNLTTCVPDCLPATWRLDMAHHILLSSSSSSTQNVTIRKNHPRDGVVVVPVWWQLVDRKSGTHAKTDCTHKSFEAVAMMNQQLVRAMMVSKSKAKVIDSV